jgi:hypothetical protein
MTAEKLNADDSCKSDHSGRRRSPHDRLCAEKKGGEPNGNVNVWPEQPYDLESGKGKPQSGYGRSENAKADHACEQVSREAGDKEPSHCSEKRPHGIWKD